MKSEASNHTERVNHDEISFFDGRIAHRGSLFVSHAGRVFSQQAEKTARLTAAEQEAVARTDANTIRDVTVRLVSKEIAGRGTAQPGADRAAKYIADRFKQLGLKPGGDNKTYLQKIKFKVELALPASDLKAGDVTFKYKDEFVILPPFPAGLDGVTGGLVFAGYGVVSPELKRDDIAGLDVKGKIVLLLGGKPGNVNAAAWAKAANRNVLLATWRNEARQVSSSLTSRNPTN